MSNPEKLVQILTMVAVFLVVIIFVLGMIWVFIILKGRKKEQNKDDLNENKENKPVVIKHIKESTIKGEINGKKTEIVIQNGALDIGLIDTMKDLIVNCIGAVVFSTLGYLYIKQRGDGKFIKQFIPVVKPKESKT